MAQKILQCRCAGSKKSFWRCGVKWGEEWRDVPETFTPAQVERLKNERMLSVREKAAEPPREK